MRPFDFTIAPRATLRVLMSDYMRFATGSAIACSVPRTGTTDRKDAKTQSSQRFCWGLFFSAVEALQSEGTPTGLNSTPYQKEAGPVLFACSEGVLPEGLCGIISGRWAERDLLGLFRVYVSGDISGSDAA